MALLSLSFGGFRFRGLSIRSSAKTDFCRVDDCFCRIVFLLASILLNIYSVGNWDLGNAIVIVYLGGGLVGAH